MAVQRALLGAITPSVRGITVGDAPLDVRIRWYFDGPIRMEEEEMASEVETEVLADMSPDCHVQTELLRIDAPDLMPGLDFWVYRRWERP